MILVFASIFLVLNSLLVEAGHCYAIPDCESCVADSRGAQKCGWCEGRCQMSSDVCANPRDCGAAAPLLPGQPFFEDHSTLLKHNPAQKNYGISVTDIDSDGQLEAVVAGFGAANLAYKWDSASGTFDDVASQHPVLQDASANAIGVAACDVDGDGYEELYVLNMDKYSGQTQTSDRLIDLVATQYEDVFALSQNQESANYVSGRSCSCVQSDAIMVQGVSAVLVANYGGPFKLFEMRENRTIRDIAPKVGMAKTTGGRSLVGGPIVSNRFDTFANNEGYSGGLPLLGGQRKNFFFLNKGDGTFLDAAEALGLLDGSETGRGTALLDSNGDGLLDIVYGNFKGSHRLFIQTVDSDGCIRFIDQAPSEMAAPSPIRTVIVADWDNDGYEEIFWNNIPGDNRLFRKLPSDSDWTQVNIGDALDSSGYGTGAAVGDFNGDGMLELLVSHGESASQPMSYFRPRRGEGNHWLRVLPRTMQGAPARGALVTISAGGRRQTRVIDPGSGYLCQQEPVAHFGLGSLSTVDSINISWPDGAHLIIENPVIDRLHDVKRTKEVPFEPAYSFILDGNCLKKASSATTSTTTSTSTTTTTTSLPAPATNESLQLTTLLSTTAATPGQPTTSLMLYESSGNVEAPAPPPASLEDSAEKTGDDTTSRMTPRASSETSNAWVVPIGWLLISTVCFYSN